jgi:hypothetical protein
MKTMEITLSMSPTTRKILLMSALSVTLILITLYFSYASQSASTPALTQVELIKPKAMRQTRTGGLQWFGMLPTSPADKQEGPRAFGEEVAELIASRKPADALTAYGIIEGCENLRPVFEINPTPAALLPRKKQCASITDAMRRSKYDYLRVAAYAGTPGVGSSWLRYGPSGDVEALRTRPNDPSVAEWKQQATALVIRDGDKGDFNALQDLMNGYAGQTRFFNADPSRALAYAIAYKDVVDLLQLGPIQNQPTDAELDILAAKLSPKQVAWAKAFAAAIVDARAKKQTSANR